MKSLVAFIEELTKQIGIPTPTDWQQMSEVEIARRFLKEVNEYFYQTYSGIGTTVVDDEEFRYFSEFHKVCVVPPVIGTIQFSIDYSRHQDC